MVPSLPDLIDDVIAEISDVCVEEITEESLDKLIQLASDKVELKAIPKPMRRINTQLIHDQLKAAPHYHVEGDDDYV